MSFNYPAIRWGAAFASLIAFSLPLDSAVAYPKFRDGYDQQECTSGEQVVWSNGVKYFLEGTVRRIPRSDKIDVNQRNVTGWDGAYGWSAFLNWAGLKNQFRWYPDDTLGTYYLCYLEAPISAGAPPLENNGLRRLAITISNPSTAFSGY